VGRCILKVHSTLVIKKKYSQHYINFAEHLTCFFVGGGVMVRKRIPIVKITA